MSKSKLYVRHKAYVRIYIFIDILQVKLWYLHMPYIIFVRILQVNLWYLYILYILVHI